MLEQVQEKGVKRRYYTEFPMHEFDALSDEEALHWTSAQFVYRESDTEKGVPFVVIRNTRPPHKAIDG